MFRSLTLAKVLYWSAIGGILSATVGWLTLQPMMNAEDQKHLPGLALMFFGIAFVGLFLLLIQQMAINATMSRIDHYRRAYFKAVSAKLDRDIEEGKIDPNSSEGEI